MKYYVELWGSGGRILYTATYNKGKKMNQIEVPILEKTIQKTQTWLKDLSRLMGWDDQHQCYTALKAVLQALRDELPTEEAIKLGAQFPMLLRGVYYDGWMPGHRPAQIEKLDDFFDQVAHYLGNDHLVPYTRIITKSVFSILGDRLIEGEIEHVKQMLPAPIASFWPS